MRSVVITGASTGIGWATAKLLLERGFRVFGSVRKQADADRLTSEFGANFTPVLFDVTDEAAVLAAAREVRAALGSETLAGLVNNAGIAVAGPVLELPADQFRRQMEVNVIGPIIATQAFGPLLGADPSLKGPRGRIVMISSLAGRNGNPLVSAYSMSKFALEGLSESLRREMMLFGINVIIIAPGAVKTPIWGKAEEVDVSGYRNSPFFPALQKIRQFMLQLGEKGLPAEVIAARIADVLTSANPKVRYQMTPDPMQHFDRDDPAEADGRQDHRQAARADAAGIGRSTTRSAAQRFAMTPCRSAAAPSPPGYIYPGDIYIDHFVRVVCSRQEGEPTYANLFGTDPRRWPRPLDAWHSRRGSHAQFVAFARGGGLHR
jgi:NAD(P)-dependent dehydrogenase (short-subunit alcohol dehydrogenase family)